MKMTKIYMCYDKVFETQTNSCFAPPVCVDLWAVIFNVTFILIKSTNILKVFCSTYISFIPIQHCQQKRFSLSHVCFSFLLDPLCLEFRTLKTFIGLLQLWENWGIFSVSCFSHSYTMPAEGCSCTSNFVHTLSVEKCFSAFCQNKFIFQCIQIPQKL